MKRVLVSLLIGRKKEYFNILRIKGKMYKIDIQPYLTVEEMMEKAASSGVLTAAVSKRED